MADKRAIAKVVLIIVFILIIIALIYYSYTVAFPAKAAPAPTPLSQQIPAATPIANTQGTASAPGQIKFSATTASQSNLPAGYTKFMGATVNSSNYGNCEGTLTDGYCIIEASKGIPICSADPRCTGFTYRPNGQFWGGSTSRSTPASTTDSIIQLSSNTATSGSGDWNAILK